MRERHRTNHAAGAMTRYAPLTVVSSWLVKPIAASARNTSTAPTQPTEDVTCIVKVNLRRAGAHAIANAPLEFGATTGDAPAKSLKTDLNVW